MRLWGKKIKVRNRGTEDQQARQKTQNNIATHSATNLNINKHLANTPNKSDHSITTQIHPNLAESGGEIRGVKKVRKCDENYVEKLKKQPNFYAREVKVRTVFFINKPMILLVYKEAYFNTNDLDHIVPSVADANLVITYYKENGFWKLM
jgi:hypothetical protein